MLSLLYEKGKRKMKNEKPMVSAVGRKISYKKVSTWRKRVKRGKGENR
jgi:hypothetical protein